MTTPSPDTPPLPDGGWSHDLLTLDQAVLVPPAGKRPLTFPAGVLTRDGAVVPQAAVWRGGRQIMLPPEPAEPEETLGGTWLWGGLLYNHFGHFLCESATRLWALDAIDAPVDGIAFFAKYLAPEDGPETLPRYQQSFLNLFGADMPVKILRVPTRAERLIVPGQGFGLGPLSSGTAPYRAAVRSRFATGVAPEGGKKLYISRSKIGPRKGGLLFETRLETLLKAEGYEVFYPEKHSLEEQVARYKAATHILAAEGSALHFLSFVARDDQQIGVIVRRISGATRNIANNLAGFSGRRPALIQAIKRNWMPETITRKHMSVAELDFPAIQSILHTQGFIGDGAPWSDISDDEATKEIRSERFRRVMNYQPVTA